MPELARLIADNKASVVANIGPLVKPVSKTDISGLTTSQAQQNLPLFLFSHNHQQRILQTGKANSLDDTVGLAELLINGRASTVQSG